MADSSSLPAPDISQEQSSIPTNLVPEEKEATPTAAINDDDTAPNGPSGASEWQAYIRGRKRKWSAVGINEKHMDDLEGIALGYHMAMMQDQLDVLHPPTPTAFSSTQDALRRLLPYHIYQVHDSELEGQAPIAANKQAQKQKEEADLARRINSVHERVFMLRRREGTHPSSLPSLISLIQSSTESLRQEAAAVQAQYKQAKGIYDTIEAEQRERERARAAAIAQANALRAPQQVAPAKAPTPALASAPAPATAPAPTPAPPRPVASTTNPVTAPRPTPPVVSAPTADTSELLPKVSRGRGRPPGSKTTPRPASTAGSLHNGVASNSSSQVRPPPLTTAVNPQMARATVPPNAGGSHPSPSGPGQPGQPSATPSRPPTATATAIATRPASSTAGASTSVGPPARPPNGTSSSSAGSAGESSYKKDALPTTPSTLRMTVKQLPQLVSLGIVTLPRDPKVKTPGYVSQISANKEIVTVVVTLAECSHIQLTTLAKMLGVAAKPAEGAAKPTEGGSRPANGTDSATSSGSSRTAAAPKQE